MLSFYLNRLQDNLDISAKIKQKQVGFHDANSTYGIGDVLVVSVCYRVETGLLVSFCC